MWDEEGWEKEGDEKKWTKAVLIHLCTIKAVDTSLLRKKNFFCRKWGNWKHLKCYIDFLRKFLPSFDKIRLKSYWSRCTLNSIFFLWILRVTWKNYIVHFLSKFFLLLALLIFMKYSDISLYGTRSGLTWTLYCGKQRL